MVRVALWVGGLAAAVAVLAALYMVRAGGEPVRASAPSALDARGLGAHLLTAADSAEVRSGMDALTKAAEQGDVEAEVALGRIYLRGLPAVPEDAFLARAFLLRANDAHHPSAAYFLGVMSQRADPAEAARWFERAAREGSPHAMFLLANAYRAGAGVPRDDEKALALYARAGEMEHAPALQALSLAYLHGELGLEPDEAESRRYAMEAEHALKHPAAAP